MLSDMMKLVDRFIAVFKNRLYGRTFYCPVCHLELSQHDVDENGCLVCPLCSVVIELYETYGHFVPVVNDVEINRHQPKARLHPLATHLPIGLFPLGFLGAGILLIISLFSWFSGAAGDVTPSFSRILRVVDNVTLIFLAIAVATSLLTFLSGFIDWKKRYGGRPYRVVTLKIILSAVFLVVGLLTVILHPAVFTAGMINITGLAGGVAAVLYFVLLSIGMFILATLGHVGGYLVFGK